MTILYKVKRISSCKLKRNDDFSDLEIIFFYQQILILFCTSLTKTKMRIPSLLFHKIIKRTNTGNLAFDFSKYVFGEGKGNKLKQN